MPPLNITRKPFTEEEKKALQSVEHKEEEKKKSQSFLIPPEYLR